MCLHITSIDKLILKKLFIYVTRVFLELCTIVTLRSILINCTDIEIVCCLFTTMTEIKFKYFQKLVYTSKLYKNNN